MKTISLLALLLSFAINSFSQTKLSGKIINSQTQLPVEYVNVGVLHSGCGSISNKFGHFTFKLLRTPQPTDTLRISSIGYKAINLPALNFMRPTTPIKLEPLTYAINEVTVKPHKQTRLGSDSKSKSIVAYMTDTCSLGREIASRIKIRRKKCQVNNFGFHIIKNTFDSLTFRLNIYTFKDGQPQENLLHEGIILHITQQHGDVKFDLSDKSIVLTQDVILSLEVINYTGKPGSCLCLSCGLGGPSFIRDTSQDNWEDIPMIRLGAYLDVDYEKM